MYRMWLFALMLVMCGLLTACGGGPRLRPEPVEIPGTVQVPGGAAGLTISFRPLGDGTMGAGKIDSSGRFTVKLIPGDYVFFFDEEANAKVATYKNIPPDYKTPKMEHKVRAVAGETLAITLQ